ncbi:MAG: hypothetical protein IPM24_16310 [Bryobacterales bacterium]|nr:hypothetical protein [Bryobacterales bacterium]
MLILACPAFGQAGFLMSGSVPGDGFTVEYRTRIEPASDVHDVHLEGGTAGWRRYLYHPRERKYFGYDVLVQPQDGEYRLSLLPLSANPEELGLPRGAWTQVPLPGSAAPQTVRAGETVAVDLLVNPFTSQRVVDYLRIRRSEPREVYSVEGAARDFTVEDAPLRLIEPRLQVNGETLQATANMTGGVSGAAVRFYVPGKGRLVLTLAPNQALGFRRAGEIRGSTLTFTAGPDVYSIECNGRIAPGEAAYHLYVHHDPAYQPKAPAPPGVFAVDAANRAALLVRR